MELTLAKTTTKLRTLGVHNGVTKVTSDLSATKTCAVSPKNHRSQLAQKQQTVLAHLLAHPQVLPQGHPQVHPLAHPLTAPLYYVFLRSTDMGGGAHGTDLGGGRGRSM